MQGDITQHIWKVDKYLEKKDLRLDVIFHLAARARIQPSFKEPLPAIQTNILGTTQVMELSLRRGARVVYAGSSSFYYDVYANPYAFSKWGG